MSGDFDAFFERTWRGMVAKAIILCGNRHDAEDAVQEAYAKAARAWGRIGGYDSPEAWVYKVMRQRLWAAARRAPLPSPAGLDLEVALPLQAGPEETAQVREVIAALGSLPGKMRFVMVMHCLNGMTQEEVAQELGLARSTVANYVRAARRLLEKKLGLASVVRRDDQALVPEPARISGRFVWPQRSAAAPVEDPLVAAIRATERLLSDGLERDLGSARRMRKALAAAVAAGKPRRTRWALWRARWQRTGAGTPGGRGSKR